MNIQEKIYLKSITGSINLLIKSNYSICIAPKYLVVRKYGDDVLYKTLSNNRSGARYWNKYFTTIEDGVRYGEYTNIEKSNVPLLWKNPLMFNYNFRFKC